MSDSFITIMIILIAAVLIFMVPVIAVSHRHDVTATQSVQTAVTEFVDKARTNGNIKQADYDSLLEKLESTGNVYDLRVSIQYIDENPSKKTSSDIADSVKIGENVYYIEYTTQIEEAFKKTDDGVIKLEAGDYVKVDVQNKNQTLYQNLKKTLYNLTNGQAGSIEGIHVALVVESTDGEQVGVENPGETGETFSINYNANGGEQSTCPPTQIKNKGKKLILSSIKPEWPGTNLRFAGWSEDPNATSAEYPSGGIYIKDKSTILYAVWKDVTYNIVYLPNISQIVTGLPEQDSELIKGGVYTIWEGREIPTTNAATFNGWNTRADGSGIAYNSGDVITIDENLILYAMWRFDTFTLVYDANAEGDIVNNMLASGQELAYNELFIIPDTIPTRENYDFLGWSTSPTGRAQYKPGDTCYLRPGQTTLYAIWGNGYTLKYNLNLTINGLAGEEIENIPADEKHYANEEFRLSNQIPTTKGFLFRGWAERPEGNMKYNEGSKFIMPDNDVTLYAVWEANQYQILFDANGGNTPEPTSKIVVYNSTYGELAKCSRTGYTFAGWFTEPVDGTEIKTTTLVKITSNQTLYAHWKIADYTLTYDANGGTGAPPAEKREGGKSKKLSTQRPRMDRYDFCGWAITSDATSARWGPGGFFSMPEEDTTLYAVWAKANYTLTYDANGGTGAPPAVQRRWDSITTLSTTEPTREGYLFKGWATTNSATTATYAPGANFTMPEANTTLYAVWERTIYTLTYDANGGIGAPPAEKREGGKSKQLSTQKPTMDRYDFCGWERTSDATSAMWGPGGFFIMPKADTTLYAVWGKTKYTLTYDANGGTGAPSAEQRRWDSINTLSTTEPTREGYLFKGWATTNSATTATYAPGSNFTMPEANTTLYAVWKKTTYTLTYDANGGTGAPPAEEREGGKSKQLSTQKPTRDRYEFFGWATTRDATSARWGAGALLFTMPKEDTTLYAVWGKQKYTLTYDANGGTGAPSSEERRWDSTTALSTTEPTREGYIFKGWATTNSATSATYTPGANFTMPEANTTLYAVWEAKTYTISYNANGGSGAPTAQTKTHGVNLILSTKVPTRTNYTFKGWGTSSTSTTAQYLPGGTYEENVNSTLYAVWELNTVDVTGISLNTTDDQWISNNASSVTLTATVSPSNATNKTVTWTSSNTAVATVNGGKITAVGAGKTTITATAGGKTATVDVYVYNAVLGDTSLNLTPDDARYIMRDSTGTVTGYFQPLDENGTKMILNNITGTTYRMLHYRNGYYVSGSGEYMVIGTTAKTTYFKNYGAW